MTCKAYTRTILSLPLMANHIINGVSMSYRLEDIRHETHDFWVLDVGANGFQVYRKGITQ